MQFLSTRVRPVAGWLDVIFSERFCNDPQAPLACGLHVSTAVSEHGIPVTVIYPDFGFLGQGVGWGSVYLIRERRL